MIKACLATLSTFPIYTNMPQYQTSFSRLYGSVLILSIMFPSLRIFLETQTLTVQLITKDIVLF
uniref:Uncharacterized protein n=1 Tax=Solanum lycopersicum TaxID=4081 RepID=A0A3Q7EV24_SOLLC